MLYKNYYDGTADLAYLKNSVQLSTQAGLHEYVFKMCH